MEPASQPKRMVLYSRVSTDEQAQSGYGLDAQRTELARAAVFHRWDVVDVVRDEGASGKDLDRPGLRHALELIAAGAADGIAVAKLDRLSRSVVDFGDVLEWLQAAGGSLAALDLQVDTSTPGGHLVANVLMAVAEWERRTIAARTKAGLAAKRARGEATGRPAIADHPALVARVLELHAEHPSLSEVARILTEEGWPTVRGGRAWRASALQRIVGYQRPPARRRRAELPDIPRRRHRRQP
jgi:DNA invertase Pin-like site-specific DNA recombinase